MTARLKWMQQLTREPRNHKQVLVAVLGDSLDGKQKVLRSDGTLEEGANQWAEQWEKDLLQLKDLEEGEALLKEVIVGNRINFKELFTKERSEQFGRIDMAQLRAAAVTREVPPEGWADQELSSSQGDEKEWREEGRAEGEEQHWCPTCGVCMDSFRALRTHRRAAHGTVKLIAACTLNNQCP
eukprot:541582-Lingulodinium_polyedra.AAC.1